MLRRIQEQKRVLTLYSGEYVHCTYPTVDGWDIVEKVIDTLTPIEEITLEMSKPDASVSCIIPTTEVLRRYLESQGPNTRGIQTLRKTMLDSLKRRFAAMEERREVVLACILDPHYKQRPLSDTTISTAKTWLQEEAEKVSSSSHSTEASSSTAATSREENPTGEGQSQSLLDSLYDDMLLSQQAQPEPPEGLLEEYLKEPILDRKTGDPLQWWKQNSGRFLKLSGQAVPDSSTLLYPQ
ncbi:hypothetical protein ANANG_G00101850 [Anguilla anguilla]|uniref:HAT C-terminal dimerisation domain-containing protein n=1 Tax=Anguilla anguilla TaxID=7936 RepID=A0A9D3MH76_ANGAN|nr:hypothetical protein ANANG_G00101850 [Anguilla anguilla]